MLNLADPDLVAAFRRLHRKLERLGDLLSRYDDVVQPATDATREIVEQLTNVSETAGTFARPVDVKGEAEAGAASPKIKRRGDASAEVSVNGLPRVRRPDQGDPGHATGGTALHSAWPLCKRPPTSLLGEDPSMAKAVIYTATRTAIGTVGRALAQTQAPKLGGIAVRTAAVSAPERSGPVE